MLREFQMQVDRLYEQILDTKDALYKERNKGFTTEPAYLLEAKLNTLYAELENLRARYNLTRNV